jgi:hypothetical protein
VLVVQNPAGGTSGSLLRVRKATPVCDPCARWPVRGAPTIFWRKRAAVGFVGFVGFAADAARSARPKGENFSVSLRIFHAEVLVANGTGLKSPTREFNPPVSQINISVLKNFHEMFGPMDL